MTIHLSNFFSKTKAGAFLKMTPEKVDDFLCLHVGAAIKRLGGHKPNPEWSLVMTHSYVDLDAVACTTLGSFYQLIPGNAKEIPSTPYHFEVKILDHPLNPSGKGTKSAFAQAAPKETNPELIQEIDEADSATSGVAHFTLIDICSNDTELLNTYQDGFRKTQEDMEKYPEMEKGCIFHPCGDYLFVELIKKNESQAAGFAIWLRERHPKLAGAVYQDGYNLGIFRYPGITMPSFVKAASKLPLWYFDQRGGWMLSWGTRKVRKTEAPPAGNPQNIDQLIKLVEREA